MENTNMVGFTDAGEPLVESGYVCPHWTRHPIPTGTVAARECWFCHWADFRKTTDATLQYSICRNEDNRVAVRCKNERTGTT